MGKSLRLLVLFLVCASALVGNRASFAQDASSAVTLPIAPDPARCSVEPRPLAEVRAAWEEVTANPIPAPSPIPDDLTGTPADEATVAAVTDLIINVLACAANGNDGLRDAAMLTDEHLRDNLNGLSEEDFNAWYTESPVANPPENWIMLYAIHDIQVLADGRVMLRPDIIVPGTGHFIDTLLLEQVDGVWKIDLSQEGAGNLYPVTAAMFGEATPAASE